MHATVYTEMGTFTQFTKMAVGHRERRKKQKDCKKKETKVRKGARREGGRADKGRSEREGTTVALFKPENASDRFFFPPPPPPDDKGAP
jgi:hypothetical protein